MALETIWTMIGVVGVGLAAWSTVRTALAHRVGADVLALLAVIGALVVGERLAAAIITLMLATGMVLEARASARAGRELRSLIDRQPRSARRRTSAGVESVPIGDVVPGDVVCVAASDVVPVDGRLVSAHASIDESALTGEPLPRDLASGDVISSGTVNAGAPVELRCTATAADSGYAGIVRLAQEASALSAPMVGLADRAALVLLGAGLATAGAAWAWSGSMGRAVAVLVVATPCPLILAVPVAISSGLSRAARRGVVVKGGATLERLAEARVLLFDKTGTLTAGRPEVLSVLGTDRVSGDEVLRLAASLDQLSSHVIADGIVRGAAERGLTPAAVTDVREEAGRGTSGRVGGRQVRVGRAGWLGLADSHPLVARAARAAARGDGTVVLVEVDGEAAGAIVLADRVRSDAARALRRLRALGIRRFVMITGDRAEPAQVIGDLVGIDVVLAARTPADKVRDVRDATGDGVVVMVGDGINDAPALAAADIGVAMAGRGGSAATEAADVVLGLDRLDRLADAVEIAQRARRIAWQSAVGGLTLSLVAMAVAAVGALPVTWGAVTQEIIDVAVILNSLRALRDPTGQARLGGADAAMAQRFSAEHDALRPRRDRLLELADAMGSGPDPFDLGPAHEALELLRVELEPHELAEEADLYPVVAMALGGSDPTAVMARGHVEISRLIERLSKLLGGIEGRPSTADLDEIRRLLYGLHAILELHTSQEEEGYLSLADPSDPAARTRP